jgi:hypothetical protein
METLTFYMGRASSLSIDLYRQGDEDPAPVLVEEGVVTRAMLRFGDYCLDTEVVEHADIFALNDDKTTVIVKGGLMDNLRAGGYRGHLTVFDALNPEGFPWEEFQIVVKKWPTCPVGP